MKSLLICTLFFIFSACTTLDNKLIINNKSGQKIDSITISVNNAIIKFTDITPGEKAIHEFNIRRDKIKYEGVFVIHIYAKGLLKQSGTFGYFANGADIKNEYEIMVYDDFEFKEALPKNIAVEIIS